MAQVFKNPLDQSNDLNKKAFYKIVKNANNNATKFIDPWSRKGGVDEWEYMVSQLKRHGIPIPENASGLDEDENGNPAWISMDDNDNEVFTPIDFTKFSQRPISPNQYKLISPGLKGINGSEIYDVFNALHNTLGPNKFYNIEKHKGLNSLNDADLQALADAWDWKYARDNKSKYFYRMKTDADDQFDLPWKHNQ